jgi:hypothetical protein
MDLTVILNPPSLRTQNRFPLPIYITSYNAKSNRFLPLPAAKRRSAHSAGFAGIACVRPVADNGMLDRRRSYPLQWAYVDGLIEDRLQGVA